MRTSSFGSHLQWVPAQQATGRFLAAERVQALALRSQGAPHSGSASLIQEQELRRLLLTANTPNLLKSQRAQLMLQLSDLIADTGVKLSAKHVCTAVSVCVHADAMPVAEQLVASIRASGNVSTINAYVFSQLIKGYCSAGQRREALSLLQVMEEQGVNRDVVIYNTLLEGWQSEGYPEGVALLWEEMLGLGIRPNERTYSAAIRCYGRAGWLPEAFKLWERMLSDGVVPTAFTYNSLLDACANRGEVKACYKVLSDFEMGNIVIKTDTYNTVMKAHARGRDADGAVKLLRTMYHKGIQPDTRTYNTVMDSCVRGHKMQRALRLYEEMRLHKLKPDLVSFATLIRAAGLLRNKDAVESVLLSMKAVGYLHDQITYRCTVYAYVHCGEGGAALEILEEMNEAGFTPAMTVSEVLLKSVDAALLRECTVAAPAGMLKDFLAEMTSAGLSPTRETAAAIVRKMSHSHGIQIALDVAEEFLQAGIRPLGLRTWQSVTKACLSNTDKTTHLAARQVDRLLRLMNFEKTEPDRTIFEAAISTHTRCGNGERALGLLKDMKQRSGIKDVSQTMVGRVFLDTMDAALRGAIAADAGGAPRQSESEQGHQPVLGGASTIMEELADIGIRIKPKAVTTVIEQIFGDIPSHDSKVAIRRPALSTPALDKGELAKAKRVQRLQRALELVEASKHLFGMQVTTFVYRPLMKACIDLQLEEEVENLWRRMRVESVVPDSATWAVRFAALAANSNLKGRTHELLMEAAGDGLQLDMELLRSLLKACCQVKDKAGIYHVRQMMSTSCRKDSMTFTREGAGEAHATGNPESELASSARR